MTDRLCNILFGGTDEEHRRTREELEELMRAIRERRSNICAGESDDDNN